MQGKTHSFAIAIDIGGTFTDVVLSDLNDGEYHLLKLPSTPEDPSQGFMKGITRLLRSSSVAPEEIARIFHGTTIATNAVLEGKGAEVGLIVSEGFKYVLEIGRHSMERLANPYVWLKPARPVPPDRVIEVSERMSFTGDTITPLDENAVKLAAKRFKDWGVESIAVCLLHSYANPDNEHRVGELIIQELPQAQVSLSSDVLPVFREYERTITTVLNAYVMPAVSSYIQKLGEEAGRTNLTAPLLIMKSNGGVIGADTASKQPVHTALSGPAAGVMAAARISKDAGLPNCVSLDMGGTSTDVSLLSEYQPTTTLTGRLGQWPLQLPMLDIATIGAGGGSLAWLSPAKNLLVGPRSAGASPGPACYGRGGTEPTVTDANLLLGRIGESIAGGTLSLDAEAACQAIQEKIAGPLGMESTDAASGIVEMVNNAMMGAIRNVSVERGHDPRQFALIAFGGAGPMHAIGVAGLLGIPTVIAPRNPGVASAYGLLVADFRNDYSQTFLQKPPDYDLESMEKAFKVLETQAERWFDEERVPNTDRCITRAADLRYAHQGFEVTIELATRGMNTAELEYLLEKFHHRHQQLFGFSLDQPTEIVTLRVAATGRMTAGNTPLLKGTLVSPFEAKTGERQVYFKEVGGFTKCPIYNRARLAPESSIDGPGILEDVDSTVVIHPGWRGRIDQYGNCVLVMV